MNNNELIRVEEVRKLVGGVSRSTIYNWVRDRQFPRGSHIGERVVVWRRSHVEQWAQSRICAAQPDRLAG